MWTLTRLLMVVGGLLALACCSSADVIIVSTLDNQTVTMFGDSPARFGPPIPLEGFKGFAVNLSPPDACTLPAPPPPAMHNTLLPWIGIARRYNCSFIDKILNAQRVGYSAVIVYNIGSNSLISMGTDSSTKAREVIIPSLFIGADDGYMLIKHFLYNATGTKYVLELTDDLPFNLENYLVPFAITIGICFIVMLSFMIVKCVRDYRRSRRHRLSSRSLKKLPIHKFKKGDPYECCAICLDDYVDNDKLRILPCEHAYHSKCIDPWLTKNRRVCPVCKRKVFTGDERPSDLDTDSEDESSPLINSEGGTQGGTFSNQRENPFQEAERQAEERRRRRRRRRTVSRNVECGPEGYQRLADSTDEDEEEEEEEEEGEADVAEGAGLTTNCGTANHDGAGVREVPCPPTISVVVHDASTGADTHTDTSSLCSHHSVSSYGTPPGPVQIAVDIVNSTASRSSAGAQPPVSQPSEDARSDRDYVV